ncbi:MAG: hypothetical protein M0R30_01170 [Methanoregula sp.]|jgi:hypothetical protein|uniref:hypothetical protein n=1 Tax=Methanoregula sp. TaxID=2052170 RepID=UPI0025FEB125|nr:hypothetical protein [Methanoregula sp.]MCK9630225.1 hypothetical protein [Methanoregula sp.]
MKKRLFIMTGLCILAFVVMPAQAFSMKSLSINVAENGDAQVDVRYDLSFIEQSAVFFRIADPASELQSAFAYGSSQPVTVSQATSSSSQIIIPSYASVSTKDGSTTMTTPSMSFEQAQAVLNGYWFAPLVSPDFSPTLTTVMFPDGYQERFDDQIAIPSISHTVPS